MAIPQEPTQLRHEEDIADEAEGLIFMYLLQNSYTRCTKSNENS